MNLAITYDQGQVFQHFGHTEQFKIVTIEDHKIVSSGIINTMGSGHGALAGLLSRLGVQVLICGGIGAGACQALKEAHIEIYAGVTGLVDEAVEAYLNHTLIYQKESNCHHHDESHACGEGHSCSGHSCK